MISTKKLATAGVAAAIFAASAMPALAYGGHHGKKIEVEQKNYGGNNNSIAVVSDTGNNNAGNLAGVSIGNDISTGNAKTNNAVVKSSVNGNYADVDSCGCKVKKLEVEQKNKGGDYNSILVASNTGNNNAGNGALVSIGNDISTGNAKTNDAKVVSLVNTNIAKVN